jgi:sugar-specific transcriptional regulator TrmB
MQQKFLFPEEKCRQFFDANPVQNTLRRENEDLHMHIAQLDEEIRKMKEHLAKSAEGNQVDDQT